MDAPPFHPQAIIFDLDGTLIDASADLATAANRTRAAFGLPSVSVEMVRTWVGHGARHLVAEAIEGKGPFDEAFSNFKTAYAEVLLDTTQVFEGLETILQALKQKGITLVVATNKPAVWTTKIIHALKLDSVLSGWASGDEREPKPHPSSLQLALERGGVGTLAPEDILYVGDMAVDYQSAQNFGCRCIGVGWGLDPKNLKAQEPDVWAETIEDFAQLFAVQTSAVG